MPARAISRSSDDCALAKAGEHFSRLYRPSPEVTVSARTNVRRLFHAQVQSEQPTRMPEKVGFSQASKFPITPFFVHFAKFGSSVGGICFRIADDTAMTRTSGQGLYL